MVERRRASWSPNMELKIADIEISKNLTKFEWKSFVNGGYIVRARLIDPYFEILREIDEEYLKTARKQETEIKWKLFWAGEDDETEERTGILVHLDSKGVGSGGELEFIAIDPPSFFLNTGNCSGEAFEGTVKEVIEKVVQKYAPDITVEVSKTNDHNKNKFYMMRQDPKTFIMSLLDWSSSITSKKTHWLVASKDDKLIIKEQAELESVDYGNFSVNSESPGAEDVERYRYVANNFVTSFSTELITSGISATTGVYLDRITDEDKQKVRVRDENTSEKKNTNIMQDRGFAKPRDALNSESGKTASGATAIMAVPEFNAGELGVKYEKWIDGRARNQFLNLISTVSRLKVRIIGDPIFDDSSELGVSFLNLTWKDAEGKTFFMSGKWLVYGWHHVFITDPNDWYTDVYLYRLDHDSNDKKVG